jgi:hypothetical protein
MKLTIPEYQAKLLPSGRVSLQYRQDEYLGGGIYKREYEHVFAALVDLTDKFGARFANRVIKDLSDRQVSTNRTVSDDRTLDAHDMLAD